MRVPKLLVLVRHAHSYTNEIRTGIHLTEEAAALIKGLGDHKIPLTDIGRRQAKATGPYVRETFGPFNAIYHSPYVRTTDTTSGILEAYTPEERAQMVIKHSHLLRERERGHAFNMSEGKIKEHFPWHQDSFEAMEYFYFRSPGGQSHADMVSQTLLFQLTELDKWADKKVLLITHGGNIHSFRYNLEGWTPEKLIWHKKNTEPKNCGVTVYRKHGEELKLESYDTICW